MKDEERYPGDEEESPLDQYRIELESFQGPLDLLLHLIKKDELDIYDIPVSQITDQYLTYLDIMRELNLDLASEFLVMASTLIHLKSRMLLPPDEEEEELEEADPREELIRRLIEYQRYKKAADELGERPVMGRDVFVRPEGRRLEEPDDIFTEASLFQLMDALQRVLVEAEKRKPHEVDRVAFTVEDGISLIEERLKGKGSLRFRDLFAGQTQRRRIVTIFLSVLELIKRGKLRAMQEDHGSPLRLLYNGKDQIPEERGQDAGE